MDSLDLFSRGTLVLHFARLVVDTMFEACGSFAIIPFGSPSPFISQSVYTVYTYQYCLYDMLYYVLIIRRIDYD